MASRTGRGKHGEAGDGVRGRLGEVWAGSGRSGPVWTGLGCPGPVWTVVGRFGRSGPVPDGLDGPGGLDRSGSGRSGPAWTGFGLVRSWAGLAGVARGGLTQPGAGRTRAGWLAQTRPGAAAAGLVWSGPVGAGSDRLVAWVG